MKPKVILLFYSTSVIWPFTLLFVTMIFSNVIPHYLHSFELCITFLTFICLVIVSILKMLHKFFYCPEIFSTVIAGIFIKKTKLVKFEHNSNIYFLVFISLSNSSCNGKYL